MFIDKRRAWSRGREENVHCECVFWGGWDGQRPHPGRAPMVPRLVANSVKVPSAIVYGIKAE